MLPDKSILTPEEVARLDEAYRNAICNFSHNLAGNPLFTLDRLKEVASVLDTGNPKDAEVHMGGDDIDAEFDFADKSEGSVADAIDRLATTNRWVMFGDLTRVPGYAEIIAELTSTIEAMIKPHGDEMISTNSFIFISSPGAFTPYHFDAEHNILFHLVGNKKFATCPFGSPWLSPEQQETFFATNDNMLPWDPSWEEAATINRDAQLLQGGSSCCGGARKV